MATTPVLQYPLDPTGINPNNKVEGEPHVLSGNIYRAVQPKHGAFYYDSIIVTDVATGLPLTKGIQYKPTQRATTPSDMFAKDIYYLIVVTDPTVSSNVTIEYQCVGGPANYSTDAIANMFNLIQNDNRGINWIDILNKPYEFNPTPHFTDLRDVYGFQWVIDSLERIREAIILSNQPEIERLLDYIDAQISALRIDLQQQIDDAIAQIQPGTEEVRGLVEFATNAETLAKTSNALAVHPAGLNTALSDSNLVVAKANTLQNSRSFSLSQAATAIAILFNGSADVNLVVSGLNADYLNAGTVPSARLSGTYPNIIAGQATILQNGRNFSISGNATAAQKLFNGSEDISLNITDLNANGLTSGTVPVARLSGTYSINISGNAGTATALATPRTFTISGGATATGVSFNGGANVDLVVSQLDATKLIGAVPTGSLNGLYSGLVAGQANKLSSSRSISISGDGSGSATFDGSADITINLTVNDDSHSHSNYAVTGHTHSQYADVNHTHSQYAAAVHTHTQYAPIDNPIFTTGAALTKGGVNIPLGWTGIPTVPASLVAAVLSNDMNGMNILASQIGGSGCTVPNTLSSGTTITIINDTSSPYAINQGSGVSMKLGGVGTTGNRTISKDGMATILVAGGVTWITGVGLSGTNNGNVVGETRYFDMTSAPPLWLPYDGTTRAITDYPELYAVIGTKYNTGGEPAGHFRLRNALGTVQMAWNGTSSGIDANRVQGSFHSSQNKAHTHTGLTIPGSDDDNGDVGSLIIVTPRASVGQQSIPLAVTASDGGDHARPNNYADLLCVYAGR